MEEKSLDLKDTLEVMTALKLIINTANKVVADGKVDLTDAKYALELLQSYGVFIEAVKDIKIVGDELKNLDEAEFLILGKEVWGLLKGIKSTADGVKEVIKNKKS